MRRTGSWCTGGRRPRRRTAGRAPPAKSTAAADRAVRLNSLLASVGLEAQQLDLGLGPGGHAAHETDLMPGVAEDAG